MGNGKKKKHISWMYILGGGILKEDFVVRHTKLIVLIVILLFFYISNRYTCLIKLREIDRMQEVLKDLQIDASSVSAELTEKTRPSQVETLVKRQGLTLERAKTPPYRLRK
jgi:sensor histidine kinase YesM